jgi:phosphatidylinositol alpha-1,6-mannosyltransferase
LPLPSFPPPRYAVFVHGTELAVAGEGTRRRALEGAWRIVCNSEFTAGRVCEGFPALASRARVAPLCIDAERLARWQAQGAPEAGAPREPAVLIVARMLAEERGKGHDELLEAWASVRARVPEARLWIVGDGDDRPRLQARARDLELGDTVEFRGRVSDAELGRLYRSASLFAMPSRQEGFGLVYAEALWHGLPCVASDADAGRTLVSDGVTGRLVPYADPRALADALASLLADPARLRAMGEAGQREARERFGYAAFARAFLAALDLSPA